MNRTRFAPSPTGFLHVGGLRTAIYCYLFARKTAGKFILRIEDTDQKRYVEGAVENLLKTLDWVGLSYDEGPFQEHEKIVQKGDLGPYIQSQRTELYREHAQILVDKGAAYPCFCTSERLEKMRTDQEAKKMAPMYDGTCMQLTPEEIEANKKNGVPFVIRQKIPKNRIIKFKDLIRGNVAFDSGTIDHQVLLKSDNFPTYHLANVVDDHLMQITHVIRGEEWLPSTPKHVLLYEAFGWTPPEFAHLPLLLNKDKTKLSKRQGDVSVEDYINKGYCKEALINFVALLGWHPGGGEEQEIFSLEELVEKFSLEQIHKAGAIFDLEKLNWFQFQWQKKLFHQELEKRVKKVDPAVLVVNPIDFTAERGKILSEMTHPYLPAEWEKIDLARLHRVLVTVEEKILQNTLTAAEHVRPFFEPQPLDPNLIMSEKMKVTPEIAKQALEATIQTLKTMPDEDLDNQETIKVWLLKTVTDLGLKNGQVFWPVRVSLTHEQFSPGVFEVIWALGKDESIKRIEEVLMALAKA